MHDPPRGLRFTVVDPDDVVRFSVVLDPTHTLLMAAALVLLGAAVRAVARGGHSGREEMRKKGALLLQGLVHMATSRDKRWKPAREPDPDLVKPLHPTATKRIILVRHGESQWNVVFNKAPRLLMPVRLLRALWEELAILPEHDSLFFDSPLSREGRAQARDLAQFLTRCQRSPYTVSPEALQDVMCLVGNKSSVAVCSMLRRAVSTAWIALEQRLRAQGSVQQLLLHSGLQEMSRNVDTLSIASFQETPGLSKANGELDAVPDFTHFTSALYNRGNKSPSDVALARIKEFAAWCCSRPEDTIIVVGHSLYFRSMFQLWLPRDVNHVAKKKKIVNCGVVGFTLTQAKLPDGAFGYRIDPDSVTVVHGGFGGH